MKETSLICAWALMVDQASGRLRAGISGLENTVPFFMVK
jgi:hypothetical protein